MKTVHDLVDEVFTWSPDLEIEFDQWLHANYSKSLSLGVEINDLIRINEPYVLRWLTSKVMELTR